MFPVGPKARFRIYTSASDYVYVLRDLLTGRATAGDDNERLVNNHERIALLQLPSQIYRGIKSDEFVVFAAEPVSLWRIWRCLGCVRLESFSRHTA